MKNLRLEFEDDIFNKMKQKKEELGVSWEKFFIYLFLFWEKEQKKEVMTNEEANKH